jgi:hypothetical protein
MCEEACRLSWCLICLLMYKQTWEMNCRNALLAVKLCANMNFSAPRAARKCSEGFTCRHLLRYTWSGNCRTWVLQDTYYCVRSQFNPLRLPGLYRFVESVTPIGHAGSYTAELVGTLLIYLQALTPRRLDSVWHETMRWDSLVKKVTLTVSATQKPVICHLN